MVVVLFTVVVVVVLFTVVVVLFTVVVVELVVVESGFAKLKIGVRSFSDCASGSFFPSHT